MMLQGIWQVEHATLPNGEFGYTGAITIQPDPAPSTFPLYRLFWAISAGQYVGVGLQQGSQLLVSCGEQFEALGLALYHPGEACQGSWLVAEPSSQIGDVHWQSDWHGQWVGVHQLLHGDDQITLQITQTGALYQAEWRSATATWHGLGLLTEAGLLLGWYPDLQQLAVLCYQIDPQQPDYLQAEWVLGGYSGLGSERMWRRDQPNTFG